MGTTQSTELANGKQVTIRISVDAPGCTCLVRESRDADPVTDKGAPRATQSGNVVSEVIAKLRELGHRKAADELHEVYFGTRTSWWVDRWTE